MIQARRIQARLAQLAQCTDEPGRITRLFLSPAHRRAIDLIDGWMTEAGLTTKLDATGTLIGTRHGPHGAPILLLGSHIDSVRDAGRYDGCLGVLAAIEAAGTLDHAIEVRAFGDEEGVRFPVTLTGARATAGTFDPAWLDQHDADGITLDAARCRFQLPADIGACKSGAFAYLELHIEQGPVLEAHGAPVGIVTAISGTSRSLATVLGRAGHVGTVPMTGREDALAAAAAMILAVRDVARARGIVATVGRIDAKPGAANVIPGEAAFTIDLRAPEDHVRIEAQAELDRTLAAIADRERVRLTIARTHEAPAVQCCPRLQRLLAAATRDAGHRVIHLPSGAGHDAMAIADLCPVGMLFVRCAGGISHHPAEHVTTDDIAVALDVLTRTLRAIDPAEFAR